jgi:hypothetical protein
MCWGGKGMCLLRIMGGMGGKGMCLEEWRLWWWLIGGKGMGGMCLL